MLALAITVLRTFFLILLYLFVFRLTVSMFEQLREQVKEKDRSQTDQVKIQPTSTGGDGAILQVLTSGEEEMIPGDTYDLGDMTKLGRGRGNHIVFKGNFASQEHARISYKLGQYWLEDLGSLNNTYLNEVTVNKPTVLANGDRIRIGEVIFRFVRWAYEMESNN